MLPISVCLISKNEEKNIERCLSLLKPYGFEIVLVDTGSTDRTRELALPYADKIDKLTNDQILEKIDEYIQTKTEYKIGERIIIIGSIPKLITGRTNFIRVHRIGAPMER